MPDGLYPYQIEDAAWLAEQQFGFVLSEQGTGKTLIAIRAADNAGIRTNIVVIAPGLVLQNHVREFARWQTIPRTLQIIDSGRAAQDLHGDVLFSYRTRCSFVSCPNYWRTLPSDW